MLLLWDVIFYEHYFQHQRDTFSSASGFSTVMCEGFASVWPKAHLDRGPNQKSHFCDTSPVYLFSCTQSQFTCCGKVLEHQLGFVVQKPKCSVHYGLRKLIQRNKAQTSTPG